MKHVKMLWEDPAIYDGWSVAEMDDGRLLNRWDPTDYPGRWARTVEYINRLKEGRDAN